MQKAIILIFSFLLLFVHPVWAQAQPDGWLREYYSDGTLKHKAFYRNGKLTGTEYHYHPNGKVSFVQTIVNGKIEGWVKSFYESGRLKGIVHYRQNVQEGLLKEFYESGKIKEKVLYQADEAVWIKRYDEQGNILPDKSTE